MKTQPIGILIGLVTLLGIIPAAAFAQSMPTHNPDAINYAALNNTSYTYSDLTIAKTRDFSDTTIAKLVKISEESQTPFSVLSDELYDGATYYKLCAEYNVSLSDLDHVQKQKDEVANYISAFETSGRYAFPDPKPGTY
jgi:hypothetical protein